MNNDLKNILANSNKDIDNQQLMDYLSNQLSKADSHMVETKMAEDEFMSDAVEGLQQITIEKNTQAYVEQLNTELNKQLAKNNLRKNKRRLKDQPYILFAIILLLILAVISFFVLKTYLDQKQAATTRQTLQAPGSNQGDPPLFT